MQLHALNGDRAGALRIYHRCMTILGEELGVDPSPAIRDLYDRLLNKTDPELQPPSNSSQISPSLWSGMFASSCG